MNMKKWGFALSLTAAFGLMACGDSSSNANGGMPTCNVTSDANSVTSTSSYGGQTVITKHVIDGDYLVTSVTYKGMPNDVVEEECAEAKLDRSAEVTCEGNTITTKVSNKGAALEILKKNAEATCKEMSSGKYIDDDEEDDYTPSKKDNLNNDPEVIDDGSEGGDSDPVNPPETNPGSGTSVKDIVGSYGQPCSVEGEKKNDVAFGMTVPLICKNGVWDGDEEAMDEMWLCSVEGSTKDTVLAGIPMTLTCEDGEWTLDETSSEEALKCDQEGATSVMMGLPVICRDGEWEMDEDSVDWGDWDEDDVIID